jgi:hypothetical protein
MDKPPACPPRPRGEQNQKKRTIHALPKPDNFIRYRQKVQAYFFRVDSITRYGGHRFGRISEDPRTGLNGSIAQTAIYGGAAQRLPFIKTECERP